MSGAAAAPTIGPNSSTGAVAAWCVSRRLKATVVGRWVWVPYAQLSWLPADEAAALRGELRAAGFRPSKRRAGWYHDCGVPARKRVTGRLDRYHRTIAAGDYVGRRGGSFAWYAKGRTSGGGGEEVEP